MRKWCAFAVALALAVFFGPLHPVFGQAGLATAQLSGQITDSSGAAVAGANVTVRNTETNATSTATSNTAGSYVVTNLPPGNYELRVSFSGFANYTQTGIILTVGQSATANVQLQVQSLGEKVVVSTEVPIIEPTKTEISQVVQTQQIESLPISNRVFTDFALLTPGVTTSRTSLGTTFTEFEVTQISFGGMRSFSNEITVDGADYVNTASGIQRATPPQESVQEFRVVNNSFGAEYGRALGGIVNIVTKSGTNELHGSIYEYFQNNALDARSYLQPAPLPDQYRQNQFGASLGGPIKKDKSFFFVNYEGKRSAQSPVYPPDLVNNLGVIDEAKALMGLAPEGCNAGLASCTGSNFGYLNGFLKTGDDDSGFVRFDEQITQNNRLAVRYNVEDTRALGELVGNTLDGGGVGVPSGGRNLFIRDQSVVATINSVLSPDVVNTVLAQYARRHYNFPGATGQPDFSVLNDLELGHNFGTNDRLYETRAQLSESVSWVKGNHVAKFGADGNWLSSLENFPGFTPVRTLVPGITCLANFAEYYNANFSATPAVPSAALNTAASECAVPQDNGIVFTYAGVPLPQSPNFQTGAPIVLKSNGTNLDTATWANAYPQSLFSHYSRLIDHGYWGLFAQDQWRITPKLTLNYGLRWDVESGLSGFVQQDYNGWQPRVGIAYSPDSKTVIRAGFGIFDDRYNLTFFFVPNTQKVVPGYLCDNNASASTTPINVPAVCAGAGIQPQVLPDVMPSQAYQGYQLFGSPAPRAAQVAGSIISTGGYDALNPFTMAGTCFTTGACGVGNGGMDHNVSRIPYAEQASAEVQRQMGGGLSIDLSYLFVGAHRLVRGNNINIPCPLGTTDSNQSAHPTDPLPEWVPGMLNTNGTFSSCSTGKPALGTGVLAGVGPFFQGALGSGLQTLSAGLMDYNNGVASANYNGGTVTVIERVKDFSLTANYTYSHTIDNGNFTTFINLPVNQLDYGAERANSNQDARQRFVTNFTATGPSDTFARNFQFSSIITLQSGRPFTIFYGANTLNDVAGGATDRVGGAPIPSNCNTAATCQTMISRNTYVGDPLYTWDFRLSRYFQLRESLKLELAVDAFNALNRPNVDEVTSVYGSPVFCGTTPAIPRHYNDAVSRAIQAGGASMACPAGPIAVPGGSIAPTPIAANFPTSSGAFLFIPSNPNPNFGLPRTMLNPRQFQLSAQFTF